MAMICVFVAANTAVAPPGGCVVFVRAMTRDAQAQQTAPATQEMDSKEGFSRKSFVSATPVIALNVCPKNAFRGWARGVRMQL